MQEFEVPEGSKCRPRSTSSHHRKGMCIQNRCRQVGCDNVLDSDKIENSCGVCGSDNGNYEAIFDFLVKHVNF